MVQSMMIRCWKLSFLQGMLANHFSLINLSIYKSQKWVIINDSKTMSDQIEGMFTSITASMVDLIVIVILDIIFLFLAKESSEMNHNLWIINYYSSVLTNESYHRLSERKKVVHRSWSASNAARIWWFLLYEGFSLSCLSSMTSRWRYDDVIIT